MKEAIRMVLESIYDPEFSHIALRFRSRPPLYLRRIKEEWEPSLVLEFDIGKCFHTINRHRLIPIFKEEIDDPKFFYSIRESLFAGRLVGGEKGLTPSHIVYYYRPYRATSTYTSSIEEIGGSHVYKIRLFRESTALLRTVVLMTKRTRRRSKLQRSPRQQSHHCGEGKELPTQSGLSFPCFVVPSL
uniref:Reverse transcriptase domain-containing protein n=1 Tax=Cannabis sativa TaxID=3483 RepID=A0A803PVC3_CANSA